MTSAGGHGTGEQEIPGEDSRHVIVYEAQTRTGSRVLEGRRVEGERSREGQRFLPRLEVTSPDTRGQYYPANKRAKALPGAYQRYFQTRHQPGFSWTPKATQDLFLRLAELVQVQQARQPLPAAAAERRIRELTCLQSRPRPAQPPHGPQPARRPSAPFWQLRPRPAPGRWNPRPRRNLEAAALNSREPSLLGFSVAGPVGFGLDVKRATAGSSLLSSTLASCPTCPCLVNF